MHKPPEPSRYITNAVDVGDVVVKVQATGTVQPVRQVNISSRLSGIVAKVNVDVNTVVHADDVLAEIDPELFRSQRDQVTADLATKEAQLASARAAQNTAQLQYNRTKALCDTHLATSAERDTAAGLLDVARAGTVAAQATASATRAQLAQMEASVRFTKIRSPVDGVVIARAVDPGAIVVASFQAPVMFTIAADLKEMRVLADIDEAEVSKVREGLQSEIVVDAYPSDVFSGVVRTLSFGPVSTAGVTTYTAYINVTNVGEKLRPGMTAAVTIRSREAKNVVRIPNSALRFRPSFGPKSPEADKGAKGRAQIRVVAPDAIGEDARVVTVRLGLSDGSNTEVLDGLTAGMRVAVGEIAGPPPKGIGRFF
jgi:HlyD family secretion protein